MQLGSSTTIAEHDETNRVLLLLSVVFLSVVLAHIESYIPRKVKVCAVQAAYSQGPWLSSQVVHLLDHTLVEIVKARACSLHAYG